MSSVRATREVRLAYRHMSEEVRQIPVERIDPSPYQPRQQFDPVQLGELAASIREQGLLQPLVVRPMGERFELIAGERRLRALKLLEYATAPALVRPYTDTQALEAALVENVQRADLSLSETAQAFHRLIMEFGYTQGEIAQRTGRSRAAIANTLRLLQLTPGVLSQVDRGELTEGHARALLMLPRGTLQEEVAAWILRNAVPVREAEDRIRRMLASDATAAPRPGAPATAPTAQTNPYLEAIEQDLRDRFGTRVTVSPRKGGGGSLTLEYYDPNDLERLLELLQKIS